MSIAIALHLLAAIVWVGGMFFAHMALRPAANGLLEPRQRLPLMRRVFAGFFPWVWASVALILVTGFWIFLGPYQGQAGLHVHIMSGLGLVMAAIFAYIWFAPYPRLGRAVDAGDFPAAAPHLAMIRRLIATNLVLGLVTSVLGGAGRYLL
ncbi:MAG: CopD family protein [Gammaproteobacteria bacterium]|nr:CopD family protein [Gammaproteobacteria bacterium]